MYYVYIIESLQNGRYYIGATDNIARRVKEHNIGKSKSTKPYTPYRLVYKEEFNSLIEARKRENFIKKCKSRKYIRELIAKKV